MQFSFSIVSCVYLMGFWITYKMVDAAVLKAWRKYFTTDLWRSVGFINKLMLSGYHYCGFPWHSEAGLECEDWCFHLAGERTNQQQWAMKTQRDISAVAGQRNYFFFVPTIISVDLIFYPSQLEYYIERSENMVGAKTNEGNWLCPSAWVFYSRRSMFAWPLRF
jgi:hypothetical protein